MDVHRHAGRDAGRERRFSPRSSRGCRGGVSSRSPTDSSSRISSSFSCSCALCRPPQQLWSRAFFFVWVSVFNLFATTVFWAFMTDLFTTEQGKRLFGFIAVGGSLGGIVGRLSRRFSLGKSAPPNFLLISAVDARDRGAMRALFPDGIQRACPATARKAQFRGETDWRDAFGTGITHVARSPYLVRLLRSSFSSTRSLPRWAYFQQADITRAKFHDQRRAHRVSSRSSISAVNTLTVLMQIFLTGRLLKWLGVGLTLRSCRCSACSDFSRWASCRSCRCWRFSRSCGARRIRAFAAGARSALHGFAARGQIQGEEFHRHFRLSRGRPDWRVVVSVAHVDGARLNRNFFRSRAARRCLVRPQFMARPEAGRTGARERTKLIRSLLRIATQVFVEVTRERSSRRRAPA